VKIAEPVDPRATDPIQGRPWTGAASPRRVLAIRLQALGDVVITLPYLQALGDRYPDATIDLVTLAEYAEIPRSLALFAHVFAVGGGRSTRRQLASATALLPRLLGRRYDVVLDLQRNRVSRWIRGLIRPRAWSEFDRYSAAPAGERTRRTIAYAGLDGRPTTVSLRLRHPTVGLAPLRAAGWNGRDHLVVLNPAGCWYTKQWPTTAYIEFARLWRRDGPWRDARFLVIGLPSLAPRVAELRAVLGASLIDLVGRTTQAEAMAIVRSASLMVSDDSGLMHMAWVSGVPTVAIFGASRADWAAPQGGHTRAVDSSDLPCGQCMRPECAVGGAPCLARQTPARVFDLALAIVTSGARGRATG
jgi:heptosyltransferase II